MRHQSGTYKTLGVVALLSVVVAVALARTGPPGRPAPLVYKATPSPAGPVISPTPAVYVTEAFTPIKWSTPAPSATTRPGTPCPTVTPTIIHTTAAPTPTSESPPVDSVTPQSTGTPFAASPAGEETRPPIVSETAFETDSLPTPTAEPTQAATPAGVTPSVTLEENSIVEANANTVDPDTSLETPPISPLPTPTLEALQAQEATVCQPIPDQDYGTLSLPAPSSGRAATGHADLNLALRGYQPVNAEKTMIDYLGDHDTMAPQLADLFADRRTPFFGILYQVYDWDWSTRCQGSPITLPEVTMIGLAANDGELVHVPDSGYSIGQGYEVLVLYADKDRITLKYTLEDNVVSGYTLHVENVCVSPDLLALYRNLDEAGRSQLPALRARQPFGRARKDGIGVAIRDNGSFMDPRSRADWWVGR